MIKKITLRITAAIASLIMLISPLAAYESIPISIDGESIALDARLYGSTTYVPLDKTARLIGDGETVEAEPGKPYIVSRGRYIGGAENLEVDGTIFVPIRSISKIYGVSVAWQESTRSVALGLNTAKPLERGEDFYISDEVYWLARIINSESGGEPMSGKIMVGNVVMNRVRSSEFPNTIYGVIFDNKYGVQFSPTANGTIYHEPNRDSIIAAKLVLDGYSLSDRALYFLNPRIATSFWIVHNREYITSIGGHDFYA